MILFIRYVRHGRRVKQNREVSESEHDPEYTERKKHQISLIKSYVEEYRQGRFLSRAEAIEFVGRLCQDGALRSRRSTGREMLAQIARGCRHAARTVGHHSRRLGQSIERPFSVQAGMRQQLLPLCTLHVPFAIFLQCGRRNLTRRA